MERMFFPVTRREAERQGIQYSSEKNRDALFPSRLRELREEKSVSQSALARVLGVSKSTIGLWETGDTLPDAKAIQDLAKYYEVSADYLLGLSSIPAADINVQKICEYTGLLDSSVEMLHKLNILGDFSGMLIDNLLQIDSVFLYQSSARFAARYWLQAELSEKGEPGDKIQECNDHIDVLMEVRDELFSKDAPNKFAKLPAKSASDFYHDRAVNAIGDIASKTIEEYKEYLKLLKEHGSPLNGDERKKLKQIRSSVEAIYREAILSLFNPEDEQE